MFQLQRHQKIILLAMTFVVLALLGVGFIIKLNYSHEKLFLFENNFILEKTRTVSTSQIVTGLSAEFVTLVNVNDIRNGKYLVKIPQNATDIKIKK